MDWQTSSVPYSCRWLIDLIYKYLTVRSNKGPFSYLKDRLPRAYINDWLEINGLSAGENIYILPGQFVRLAKIFDMQKSISFNRNLYLLIHPHHKHILLITAKGRYERKNLFWGVSFIRHLAIRVTDRWPVSSKHYVNYKRRDLFKSLGSFRGNWNLQGLHEEMVGTIAKSDHWNIP